MKAVRRASVLGSLKECVESSGTNFMLVYCVLGQNWAGLWRREFGYCCCVAVPVQKLLQIVYFVTQNAPLSYPFRTRF